MLKKLAFAALLLLVFIVPAAPPPKGEPPAPPPDNGQIDRKDEKPERDHPESQHGQKSEQAPQNQQNTDRQPDDARTRQIKLAAAEFDFWRIQLRLRTGLRQARDAALARVVVTVNICARRCKNTPVCGF